MKTLSLSLAAALVFALSLASCAAPAAEEVEVEVEAPSVAIAGDSGVLVGETLQLSASTINGDDSAYTWASEDELIATVDDEGLVIAIGAGETTVTATGVDSGLSASHNVVVIPEEMLIEPGEDVDEPVGDGGEPVGDVDGTVEDIDEPVEDIVEPDPVPESIPEEMVPYYEQWMGSGHADKGAEAFVHWDEDGSVPTSCARCHSTGGFMDYLGADGTEAWVVDNAAELGTTVECNACHNTVTPDLDSVTFPSGEMLEGLGGEARCMTCHQGRASTVSVDEDIEAAAVGDDEVSDQLSFENIHYYAAGATLFAGQVKGGYQYDGMVYDWSFRHVEGYDSCIGCHDSHTLEPKLSECGNCHEGVVTAADTEDIRMIASVATDYDGDGDTSEGIFHEVEGLRGALYAAIQAYAVDKGNPAICYEGHSYPYWFIDSDGSGGACGEDEASYPNKYGSWTPRLVRGTYNYQVSLKDTGAHVHNAKYVIQLLHDSLMDLNGALATPEDLSAFHRNDPGHFDGASEAARHWDDDETVSASCSKCHAGAEGFVFFLEYGVGNQSVAPDNGLECSTCHTTFGLGEGSYAVREVGSVVFPSGAELDLGSDESNLCATCHSGREAKATIDDAIAAEKMGFKNVHYLPAGAVKMGTSAMVGYEWADKEYAAEWTGHPGGDACTSCHRPESTAHVFDVESTYETACSTCHNDADDLWAIRGAVHGADYDGDGLYPGGAEDETLNAELETLAEALYEAIQAYAEDTLDAPICYEGHSYPYFFKDTDGSGGECDGPAEANYGNKYGAWDATLMKAAHNLQIFYKEPGAWAHNFDYMGQLLYDAIEAVGGDVTAYTRP